jgi:hypothetical protein
MSDVKQRARELLAAELRRDERHYTADEIVSGEYGHVGDLASALRAIEAALSPEQGVRDAAIEECALIADLWDHRGDIAKAIRALKQPGAA